MKKCIYSVEALSCFKVVIHERSKAYFIVVFDKGREHGDSVSF